MAEFVLNMKYIMYPNEQFMFVPPFVPHNRLARVGAISAGFVTMFEYPTGSGEIVAECSGDSESLKLQARSEDSEIITVGLKKKWGD